MSKTWQCFEKTSDAAKACFHSLQAVFELDGEPITSAPMSDVIKVCVEDKDYYVKRYTGAGKGLRRFVGRSRLQGEYDNLRLFQSLQLPTPIVTGFGIETKHGVFKRGALITESLDECTDLMTLFQGPWQEALSQPVKKWKHTLIDTLAPQVARLHETGFVHNDLKWRNLLLNPQIPHTIYFMDCPVGRVANILQRTHGIIKDLACLDKYAPGCFSRSERLRFLKLYLQARGLADPQKKQLKYFARQIAQSTGNMFKKKHETLVSDNTTVMTVTHPNFHNVFSEESFRTLWTRNIDLVDTPNKRGKGWSEVGTTHFNDQQLYFVKRQENFTYRDVKQFGRRYPIALREFRNLTAFELTGLPTQTVAYFAYQKQGRQYRAILITPALEGYQDLDAWLDTAVNEGWSFKKQDAFIRTVALCVRNMHNSRFVHNCLYPKHLLIKPMKTESSNDWDIRFIDLEKAFKVKPSDQNIIRDLDTLNRRTKNVSRTSRLRFLKHYLGDTKDREQRKNVVLRLIKRARVKSK